MRYKYLFIDSDISIKESIRLLDKFAKKVLLVTKENVLEGILTDGDIRRWILKNGNLDEKVYKIMNSNPIFLLEKDKSLSKQLMKEKSVECIPILNNKKEVVDVVFWNDNFLDKLNYYKDINVPVVIMAGGKGTRLYPYTKILPKPLIPIEDTPIIERIIDRFIDYGCKDFYLTVNYKKNMIKAYFNELDRSYNIHYVEEDKPLGTGGSLNLLKDKIKGTFFVINCDVLIEANYSDILKYHKKNNNKITVVTSLKNYKIPYGVIELSDTGNIINTIEKPEYNFLVNTGMYILEPEVLDDIPSNKFFNITDLIDNYINIGKRVGTYPVTNNSWLDMGEFKEMERMVNKITKE